MQLFVITKHCTSKQHCDVCRNKEGGRAWRSKLTKDFLLPDNNVDFECPYGAQWEDKTPPNRKVQLPAKIDPLPVPVVQVTTQPIGSNPPPHVQAKIEEAKTRDSNTRGGCGCGRRQ